MEIKGQLKRVIIDEKKGLFELYFEPFEPSLMPLIYQLHKQTEDLRVVEIVFIDEN